MDIFSLQSLFILFVCVLVGMAYAFLLYRWDKELAKGYKYALGILRTLVVATVAWLLFAPMAHRTSFTLQKPLVFLVEDNSQSIGLFPAKNFNLNQYKKDLLSLKEALSKKYEVLPLQLSAEVKPGLASAYNGTATNLSKLFSYLKYAYAGQNLGAVILATDGLYNQGGNPLYASRDLNVPVFTIALGDTTQYKDAVLQHVLHQDLVLKDAVFSVEAAVEAYHMNGQELVLQVFMQGQLQSTKRVQVGGDQFSATIPLQLKAGVVGLKNIKVVIAPAASESNTRNNVQQFFVEVLERKQKVLLAYGAPHPDIRHIKAALDDAAGYSLQLLPIEALGSVKPLDYDVFILHQIPFKGKNTEAFLAQLKALEKPVWYILGLQSDLTKHSASMSLQSSTTQLQELYADFNPNFNLFLTDSIPKIHLDPLLSPAASWQAKDLIEVLYEAKASKTNVRMPLWFFRNEDHQKQAYLMAEGLWQWAMNDAAQSKSATAVLLRQSLQYLAAEGQKPRFKVLPGQQQYNATERVWMQGSLYNESMELHNQTEVKFQLKNTAGKLFDYMMSKKDMGYVLDLGYLPAGVYHYSAQTIDKQNLKSQGQIYVGNNNAEYMQTRANHQFLADWSAAGHAAMRSPAQLLELQQLIEKHPQMKSLRKEQQYYQDLINFKTIFICILLLLSVEWFMRKQRGVL